MTMGVSEDQFEWLKQKLVDFRDEIQDELQKIPGKVNQVVQLNLQLYPGDGCSSLCISENAQLSSLNVSVSNLDPFFDKQNFAYNVPVFYLTTSISVTPLVEEQNSTVKIGGLPVISGQPSTPILLGVGNNLIQIEITAPDGVTTQTYALQVTRDSVNDFANQASLKASNSDSTDSFGAFGSVAIDNNTLVVGAYEEDGNDDGLSDKTGAAYVFERNSSNGDWTQTA